MSKEIPPNGCLYCELPHNIHGSRLDGLHPSGVLTWTEPTDKLRLERMKRNRAIRKGTTMKSYGWAKYIGANRRHIFAYNEKYNIADVSKDGKRVALDPGNGELEWMHVNAVEYVTPPEKDRKVPTREEVTDLQLNDLLEPNKATLANLDAEIKRVEERLTALRAARAVVASL